MRKENLSTAKAVSVSTAPVVTSSTVTGVEKRSQKEKRDKESNTSVNDSGDYSDLADHISPNFDGSLDANETLYYWPDFIFDLVDKVIVVHIS